MSIIGISLVCFGNELLQSGHSIVMNEKNINKRKTNNITRRSFDFYVLLFFLLAFAGWLWEVGLYFVTTHTFVNRGLYRGPYLPIYGAGGIVLWFLLQRFYRKPGIVFLFSAGICSVLEYLTSVFLEWKWGMRWWDYSGHFFNLQGRICLLGAVAFGLGGMMLICYLFPLYMKGYHRLSKRWRAALCLFCLAVFVLDITYCAVFPNMGNGVTQMSWNIF